MEKQKILLPKDPVNTQTPWLWIGTWSMGGEAFGSQDTRESLKVLTTAVENNIRHFDTAGFYAHGKSERLLSQIIRTTREEFFISTKGGLMWDGKRVLHRASPKELEQQLSESLERLNTDYLDLYQLHWPDPQIPVKESIGALKELQKKELIRYWGVGNLTEKQIKEHLINETNIPHQVHFNPLHRSHDVLNAGKDACINCIISPLEQGVLGTGKSSLGKQGIGKKDIRNRNPYFSDINVLTWNSELNELLKNHPISKVSLVLMWICVQPHVHAIIPGPRKLEQVEEILDFKKRVEGDGLLSTEESNSIMSLEKAANLLPSVLLQFLNQGLLSK